jgi:cbb3-type cytochrome oxidase subunit 3
MVIAGLLVATVFYAYRTMQPGGELHAAAG